MLGTSRQYMPRRAIISHLASSSRRSIRSGEKPLLWLRQAISCSLFDNVLDFVVVSHDDDVCVFAVNSSICFEASRCRLDCASRSHQIRAMSQSSDTIISWRVQFGASLVPLAASAMLGEPVAMLMRSTLAWDPTSRIEGGARAA